MSSEELAIQAASGGEGSHASQSVSASSGEVDGKRSKKRIYTKDGLVSAREGSSGSSSSEWSSDEDEGKDGQGCAVKDVAGAAGTSETEIHIVSSGEEAEEEEE